MAFNDLPNIDNYSINSDKSEIALRQLLNQANGFICRADVPDKGCDFDVELITNGKQASNWRFALQLKSLENLNMIDNNSFVSYSFETSRLGYLIRRQPAMGIVVLYSISENKLYYDYVDAIYERLMNDRNSDDWKQNEKVNIRIPCSNILDEKKVEDLHIKFLTRFQNAQMMQAAFGIKYNLPAIDIGESAHKDLNNPEHIKTVLKKYGIALLSSYELSTVFQLVSQLSMAQINAEKELQIIAAVTYCETSKNAEASYYFDKLKRRNDIADYEKEMVLFAQLKNDLSLGRLTRRQFVDNVLELRKQMSDGINRITLDINLSYFALLELNKSDKLPSDLFETIQQLYSKINSLASENHIKALLKAWNSDNFSLLIGHYRGQFYATAKMREFIGEEMDLAEKSKGITILATLEKELADHLDALQKEANDHSNNLLLGNIILTFNRHRLSHELDLIAYQIIDPIDKTKHFAQLKEHIGQAIRGFKLFEEKSHFKEAYQSLCNAIDFIIIIRDWHGCQDELNLSALETVKENFEKELEFDLYVSPLPKLIQESKIAIEKKADPLDYKDLTDEQIEYIANLTLKSMALPKDRLTNIINEMEACRLFYSRCSNKELELIQYDPLRTKENRFSKPSQFVIRSKATGLGTRPSSDMEYLLKSWRL